MAVGLFGDWGSGKSYFLDAIKLRIDQLTESDSVRRPQQVNVEFWKHIVQVEFNAWHYVEGDLWSSLVDHIFSQLNLASENVSDNIVARRQRYLLGQLATAATTLKELSAEKQELEDKRTEHERELNRLREKQARAIEELNEQRAQRVATQAARAAIKTDVVQTLEAVQLGTASEPKSLGEAAASLSTARSELERGWSLVRPFLKKPLWLVLLLVCLLAAPVIAWAIEQLGRSSAAATLGGFTTVLTVLSGAISFASRWVHKRLDLVTAAQVQVDAEISAVAAELQANVEKAQRKVDEASAEVEESERQQAALNQQIESIQRERRKKPQEVLNDFLRDRLKAGDYRKRLGVPAIIRRDFKDLADLISFQNAYQTTVSDERKAEIRAQSKGKVLDEDDEDEGPLIINRIILYIDDLDRCPDGKVIEVLQAVHMLLAFPLFVVVVAVDARWLAHALQSRYPALAGGGFAAGGRPARPDDYLEKIFQIPFWVADLSKESRGAIVRGLLGSHVRAVGAGAPEHVNGQVFLSDNERRVPEQMIGTRNSPPQLDVTALQVTRDSVR